MKRLVALIVFGSCMAIAMASLAASKKEKVDSDNRGLSAVQKMNSEQRFALIIGNSDYQSSPLKNPVNDARAMEKALSKLGFQVEKLENASEKQIKRAIDEFGERIRSGGVAFFYYAGHGMQVKGENYLIPVGAKIESEYDVEYESVALGRLLAKLHNASTRVNIVMLDACRDNPFARSFRSSAKGLATLDAPRGTYIGFATAPGTTASDGSGTNGLFTEAFIKAIQHEGAPLEKVFKTVRTEVREKSSGKQIPWDSSSMEGEFYFKLPSGVGAAADAPASPIGDGFSLDDLKIKAQDQEKNRNSWKDNLNRMKTAFSQAEAYENKNITPDLKMAAWNKFLESYSQKNPYFDEDDTLRDIAREKVEKWRSEEQRIAMISRPQVTHKQKSRNPVVLMETGMGNVKLELFEKEAPISVKNFLEYVNSGFYSGTIFHRVIAGFMIQGGGFTADLRQKPTRAPIKNEAANGLKNDRGTIAMARTSVPDSATSQFFINVVNNEMLNRPSPDGFGYAVFGKVIEGMEVVDRIKAVRTGTSRGMADVPVENVVIKSMKVVK